jgi:hypothetical protein
LMFVYMCINLYTRCVHLSHVYRLQSCARVWTCICEPTSRDTICIHMYPCANMCVYYTIVYLLHYLLKYLSTESTIIHAGLGEGLGKGHPAAHGYSFGSLRRRGVAPVCRCRKVSGNYKSTNNNWVMDVYDTHTYKHYIYIIII